MFKLKWHGDGMFEFDSTPRIFPPGGSTGAVSVDRFDDCELAKLNFAGDFLSHRSGP